MAFASANVSHMATTEPRARVRRLALTDFRNYAHVDVDVFASMERGRAAGRDVDRIVLYGANGAGKTNLLEAMSLLGPGRGLRRATLQDLDRDGAGPWSIEATVDTTDGPVELFTGRDGESDRRNVRLFDRPLRGRSALAELLTVTWLDPAMDRLLVEGPGARRRFLDRLAAAVQPDHSARVAAYERAMRERSVLLREGGRDAAWLRALEQRMVEPAVAIAAARLDALAELNERLYRPEIDLPSVCLESTGEVEEGLGRASALDVEQELSRRLAASRGRDALTGGAAHGTHRADLVLRDVATGEPAGRASTGRQKAMLLAIVLAEADLVLDRSGVPPILLLDEVAAHLDEDRREALCEALVARPGQTWLTGTDRTLFSALEQRGLFLHVDQGRLSFDE